MAEKKRTRSGGLAEANRRLGRIESTLATASRVFEHMDARLERLEGTQDALVEGQRDLVTGQRALVEGQRALVEGQRVLVERMDRVVDRLDMLVEATTRDRTGWVDRFGRVEQRLERLETEVFPPTPR